MSDEIKFNNLTYYFKIQNLTPINFIAFRGQLHIYEEIKNVSIKKVEENQKELRPKMNEITARNSTYKDEVQSDTIENIRNLYNSRQKIIDLFNDYTKIISEAKYKAKYGEGLGILTSKQMLQRLPIALGQVKAGNNAITDKLFILCNNQKKLQKIYTIIKFNQYKYKNGYYIDEL